MAKSKTPEYDGSTPLQSPKQEQFAHEYIIDLNGRHAAIRAKYSPKAADQTASRLLSYVKVKKRIEYLKTQSIERVANKEELALKADTVLQEVSRMAFGNIADFIVVDSEGYAHIDLSKATREQMAVISALEVVDMPPVTMMGSDGQKLERQVLKVKFKMWDKIKSLEMLMKHFDLLKDKVEIEGLSDLVEAAQKGRERVAAARRKRKSATTTDD